jgi:hypothetical protein
LRHDLPPAATDAENREAKVTGRIANLGGPLPLEPVTQHFIDRLPSAPTDALSSVEARVALIAIAISTDRKAGCSR